jgi:hypothetical protein
MSQEVKDISSTEMPAAVFQLDSHERLRYTAAF